MAKPEDANLMDGVLHADPYLHTTGYSKDGLENAVFICEYDVSFSLLYFTEAAFLLRREDVDELWLSLSASRNSASDEANRKRAYVVRRAGNEHAAARRLLHRLFGDRTGYGWPGQLQVAGLVDEAAFKDLVQELESKLRAIRAANQLIESDIVRVAGDFGLSPEPSFKEQNRWMARCPETNHHLHMDPSKNLFMCGWCKQGGGIEELRKFVEQRRVAKCTGQHDALRGGR